MKHSHELCYFETADEDYFLCVVKRCLFDAYLPPPSLSQIELKYNAVFLHVLVSGIGFY